MQPGWHKLFMEIHTSDELRCAILLVVLIGFLIK